MQFFVIAVFSVSMLSLMAAPAKTTQAGSTTEAAAMDDPKPMPPAAPDLDVVAAFDCRQAGPNPPDFMRRELGRIHPLSQHALRLANWYGRQLINAGVWTPADAAAFLAAMEQRPELAENREWAEQIVPVLQRDVAVIGRQSNARDYVGACRTALTMVERVGSLRDRYQQLWAGIDAIYAAEAARLNVTLR